VLSVAVPAFSVFVPIVAMLEQGKLAGSPRRERPARGTVQESARGSDVCAAVVRD
jgi:hypothetical protein